MRRRSTGAAPLFAALGDENRLSLIARLCAGGPTSITSLASGASVTRQAITKHLRVMERAGIVRSVRHGRECLWSVEPGNLNEARRYLKQISTQWDAALERLKKFVE
jgi:DNA-binding transcriptional ArsR family regulator